MLFLSVVFWSIKMDVAELQRLNVSFLHSELLEATCTERERDLFLQINMISAEDVEPPQDMWRQANVGQLISSGGALKNDCMTCFLRELYRYLLSIEDCCTQKKSVEFRTNDFILSCKCFVHKLGLLKTETLLKVFLLEFNFLLKSSKTNKKKSSISAVMTAGWISNLNTSLMTLWFLL